MRLIFLVFFVIVLISGCDSGSNNNSTVTKEDTKPVITIMPITNGDWYRPSIFSSWQWQLQGEINTSYPVDIYDIDLFDTSETLIGDLQASGVKVICYFSAGTYEVWRTDAESFRSEDLGDTLAGWVGERWLNIRSEQVKQIITGRLDLAKQKNCDGVEPDNVDGFVNNTGFKISSAEQINYNRFIANEAHKRGLSVALKNATSIIDELVDYFDFAINERCFEYSECSRLIPFINVGKAVLSAEYHQNYIKDENIRQEMCSQSIENKFSTLVLPLKLDEEFRYSCLYK